VEDVTAVRLPVVETVVMPDATAFIDVGDRKGWRTRRVSATASATPIASFLALARIVACPLKVF